MNPTPFEWVTLLYAGITPPNGFIEFRFLKSGKQFFMPWPTFLQHPDLFTLKRAPKGQEIYMGVSLRKDATDGTAANCHTTHLHWCDVDLKDHPDLTNGQTDLLSLPAEELAGYKQQLLARIMQVCDQHDLPPRAIVDSGHGLQVYWARRNRSTFADTESFNRGLANLLGGDLKSIDVARILRVPGAQNLKNKKRPLTVGLLWEDPEAWVEHEALAPHRAEKPAAPLPPIPAATVVSAGLSNTQEKYSRYAAAVLAKELEELKATGEGGRNHALNKAAFSLGTLVAAGILDEVQAIQQLSEAGYAIGLGADEVPDTIKSGLGAGKLHPRDLSGVGVWQAPEEARGSFGKRTGPKPDGAAAATALALPEKPALADYRDLVLASFSEMGYLFRYHQIWRSWWVYAGGVYEEVPDEVMLQTVDLTLQGFGYTLKNAQVVEILTKISRDAGIGSRAVSQDPWELNTQNGILNLRDGQLYDHTPDYFSIIQSAAAYRPEMVAYLWQDFLAEAVPDEADRLTLQQFAGLCLTGDTSAQRALVLVGDGGTGKGTFVRVLEAVLGNLAASSALENIKDGSFLVGTLVGKRMCVVSELQKNVDWLPFKRITGEDQISVDIKNKTPYSTKLDMKLILLTNVMPYLGEDTSNSSLMRRFLPIAFDVQPAVQDPTLPSRLTHPDELPGVLNWMLEGLASLRANSMRFPLTRTSKVAREIVEESNRVVTFLRDECAYQPEVTTPALELYLSYQKWAAQTGHKPLSLSGFSKQLLAAGKHLDRPIERVRKTQGTFYVNVQASHTAGGWDE